MAHMSGVTGMNSAGPSAESATLSVQSPEDAREFIERERQQTDERNATYIQIAAVFGGTPLNPKSEPPAEPFGAGIGANFVGAVGGFYSAVAEGRLSVVDFDEQSVCMLPDGVQAGFRVNNHARLNALWAQRQPQGLTSIQLTRNFALGVKSLLTFDNPWARSLIRDEMWRIALAEASRQIQHNVPSERMPQNMGGHLHRAVTDSNFRNRSTDHAKGTLRRLDQTGHSFIARGAGTLARITPEAPYGKIVSGALSDRLKESIDPRDYVYVATDMGDWDAELNDRELALALHAGRPRGFFGEASRSSISATQHEWEKIALLARNKNGKTPEYADRIVITSETSGVAVMGSRNNRLYNVDPYNIPRAASSDAQSQLIVVPGFPASDVLSGMRELLIDSGAMDVKRTHSGAKPLYENLCGRVVAPNLIARAGMSLPEFAGELPTDALAPADISALHGWAQEESARAEERRSARSTQLTSLPGEELAHTRDLGTLPPVAAVNNLAIAAHNMGRIEELAKTIYAKLIKEFSIPTT